MTCIADDAEVELSVSRGLATGIGAGRAEQIYFDSWMGVSLAKACDKHSAHPGAVDGLNPGFLKVKCFISSSYCEHYSIGMLNSAE